MHSQSRFGKVPVCQSILAGDAQGVHLHHADRQIKTQNAKTLHDLPTTGKRAKPALVSTLTSAGPIVVLEPPAPCPQHQNFRGILS